MGAGALHPDFSFVTAGLWLADGQLVLALLLYFLAFCYIAGPRFFKWLEEPFFPVSDWVLLRVPWRYKRMQRDFYAMLALLLDAQVPEPKAVQLAAASTANLLFQRRARRVVADLEAGKGLAPALQHLDNSGEFKWRLDIAARGHGGFFVALNGWLQSLDAKAFQQEQSASQLLTTSVIIFNGIVVALLVTGVFRGLIGLINAGVMW